MFGAALGVAAIAGMALFAMYAHQPEISGDKSTITAPPALKPELIHRPLAWFDDLVAAGHRDQAVRAALVRLKAEGPKAPGSSTDRDDLIARLIAVLPQLDSDLAREVEIALVKQPLNGAAATAVLARLDVITDPKLRIQALRKLLENDLPAKDLIPLLSDADPRVRAGAARSLRRQTGSGNFDHAASANKALAEAQKTEADPRVRQAMMGKPTDEPPVFSEDRRHPVVLPSAAERAPAHLIESVWEPTPGETDFVNRSTITIDHSGMAHVETVREEPEGKWHVTYDAWAWKDANGNLIIDGRGQKVNYVGDSNQRGWSPDSMTIKPDGTTSTIDDRFQQEVGHSTQPGSG